MTRTFKPSETVDFVVVGSGAAGGVVVVLLLESRLLEVYGELQREGDVQHVIARQLTNLSWLLGDLQVQSRNFH